MYCYFKIQAVRLCGKEVKLKYPRIHILNLVVPTYDYFIIT